MEHSDTGGEGRARAIAIARIRALATRRGWSNNRLADFSGVARGYVSMLLAGKLNPTLDQLEKIANALEVETWELLRPVE